ncbi:MAG: DUF3524 domain-containing protein [Caldilineae bacterium]|nr:MAG: DUF3524 domain-containing protein [Caldilineae bacterium]
MHILLLEPYLTGSHRSWAEEYARFSAHTVHILGLPGRFWKWRMHGGAITLARQFLAHPFPVDVLVATDMLDLTTFLALTRRHTAGIPCALYFHENQLTYPWSPQDRDVAARRDRHYGFINFASALAADALFFNSPYHMEAFFEALPPFLRHFPDFRELETVEQLQARAKVLPLGLDLRRLDAHRPPTGVSPSRPPRIVWNHRWEYDKNPSDFFEALYTLAERQLDFEVVLLGENFRNAPEEFTQARVRLGERIVQFGYEASFAAYACHLWQADLLPVTSRHDFFGASVVQAMYCGCYPLVPDRLAYPWLIPSALHSRHLYRTPAELVERLAHLLRHPPTPADTAPLRAAVRRFDWETMAPRYDRAFEALAEGGATKKPTR